MEKYDHKTVESKWQRYWEDNSIFRTEENKSQGKYYCLDMFPYPSSAGLHVGHPEGYTATDIVARYRRMKYKENVLHPMGFDAFGLPAENYAIKVGRHPSEITEENIKNFIRQLKSLGFSYDWDRQIVTSRPGYYKWTQWMFRELYKMGLAYKKKAPVNWCESCKTVLAREQVIDGKCERCKNEVIQKELSQWFFRITDYAEELLTDIDKLDWPEPIKALQRNWIGKSEGALIKFNVQPEDTRTQGYPKGQAYGAGKDTNKSQITNFNTSGHLEVFTTRPDTIFGATYMVVAPEHPLIMNYESGIMNYGEVEKYIKQSQKKSELERTDLAKEKTGIELKGIKAINPANNEEVPIFVADYVLMGYGTGAIMAVPAHDERDFEFAKKYNLPIKPVVKSENQNCIIVHGSNSTEEGAKAGKPENLRHWKPWLKENLEKKSIPTSNELFPEDWKPDYEKWKKVFEKNDINENTIVIGHSAGTAFILRWLSETKQKIGKVILVAPSIIKSAKYQGPSKISNMKDFEYDSSLKECFNNLIIIYSDDDYDRIHQSVKQIHSQLGGEVIKLKNRGHFLLEQMGTEEFPELLNKAIEPLSAFTGDGIAINSGEFNGLTTERFKQKINNWLEKNNLGKRAVNYKLRDWLVSRQRYWGAPIPIIYCENCAKQKPTVLLIHGTGGHGNKNWLPWLKQELENKGYQVFNPDLPNSSEPELKAWLRKLDEYKSKLNENSIIVGHSLGCPAALNFVQSLNHEIKKLICIAPTHRNMNWGKYETEHSEGPYQHIKKVSTSLIDYKKVDRNTNQIICYFSTDDPHIPLSIKDEFKKDLSKVKNIVLENRKHFSEGSQSINAKELPEILDEFSDSEELKQGMVLVPEKDLPVELPSDVDFRPTGESPLAVSKKFHQVKCPNCGATEGVRRESDTMDTFVCSSWYFLRYCDPKNNQAPFDKEKTKQFMPVDLYVGGAEHAVMHLMYARFFTKALADAGHLDFREPFKKLRNQGMILAEDGHKMSKSLGNVINPDQVVAEYGADTFRMYEMFMGPLEDAKPWSTKSIIGIRRFLEKIWNLQEKVMVTSTSSRVHPVLKKLDGGRDPDNKQQNAVNNKNLERLLHQTIKKVTEDIEDMKFNTAISAMMILVNAMEKEDHVQINNYKLLVTLLSPFAPHISEELWRQLGYKQSILNEDWPQYDPKLTKEDKIELAIQINGKVRDKLTLPSDISENDAKTKALESPKVQKWLDNKSPKKIIFIQGKLISIVV